MLLKILLTVGFTLNCLAQDKVDQNTSASLLSNWQSKMRFDLYYGYYFNRPFPNIVSHRKFDRRHNDLSISLLELSLERQWKRSFAIVNFHYGEMAELNSSDSVTTYLGEAYFGHSLTVKKSWWVEAGKFQRRGNLEKVRPVENANYSLSYAASMEAPIWFEGVKLANHLEDGKFSIGIFDGVDRRIDNNRSKTYGIELERTLFGFSGYYGAENEQNDRAKKWMYHGYFNVSFWKKNKFSLALSQGASEQVSAAIDKNKWWSTMGIWDYQASWDYGLSGRLEFYSDDNFAEITSLTMTQRLRLEDGHQVRLEWRSDLANSGQFNRSDSSKTKKQHSIVMAWLAEY